jgi:chorismate mutase/prephenate dehydratase
MTSSVGYTYESFSSSCCVSMTHRPDLQTIRDKLDSVDKQIVDGLAQRILLVSEVARIKSGDTRALRDILREEELLTKLLKFGSDLGVDRYLLTRVYQEILEHSLRLQENYINHPHGMTSDAAAVVAAFQGTEGSYSHAAATRFFRGRKESIELRGFATVDEVLRAVETAAVTYGVIAIENTAAGSLNESYESLTRARLHVIGEEVHKIEHYLMALQDVPLSRIKRIYSHPLAIFLCSNFLASVTHAHVETFPDTAMAARKIRDDQDLSQAAIASKEAARLYGLHILKKNVANQKVNFTRYMVVAREPVQYDLRIPCKTSIIFGTSHEHGALLRCLQICAEFQLNLTKLESRPRADTPWEYLFYMDFEGNVADPTVQNALQSLTAQTSYLKVLGSYPARTTKENRPAEPRPLRAATGQIGQARQTGQLGQGSTASEVAVVSSDMPSSDPVRPHAARTRGAGPRVVFEVAGHTLGGQGESLGVELVGYPSVQTAVADIAELKERGVQFVYLSNRTLRARDRGKDPAAESKALWGPIRELHEAAFRSHVGTIVEVRSARDLEDAASLGDMLALIDHEGSGTRALSHGADPDMRESSPEAHAGNLDKPIMVMRGVTESEQAWVARAQQIMARGNRRVALCDAGLHVHGQSHPMLDLVSLASVGRALPVPVWVQLMDTTPDDSQRAAVGRAARAIGLHGLMFRVGPHHGPSVLTVAELEEILTDLRD